MFSVSTVPRLRCVRVWPAAAALAVGACASSSERADAPVVDADRQRELRAAEASYRAGDPAFVAARDQLAKDPSAAFWLTRMLVRDIVVERDHGQEVNTSSEVLKAIEVDQALADRGTVDHTDFLRSVQGQHQPLWDRALPHLRALGSAALPALEQDLVRSRFGDRRQIGVDILAAIGPDLLPALTPLVRDRDPVVRRAVAAAIAGMAATPAAVSALTEAADDAEFGVRAVALRGLLHHGGAAQAERLRRAIAGDPDPFVRRTAALQLGAVKDQSTATALVAYLRRCLEQADQPGASAADQALRQISGRARAGNLQSWEAWLASWQSQDAKERT